MSLKICSFASGSKGNCTFVSDGKTNILIDLGISATRADKVLTALGVAPGSVHVLVTHSHSDHIGGIKVFSKKYPLAAIHAQSEVASALYPLTPSVTVEGRVFEVGEISVTAVPVSHDVPCFGYVLASQDKRVAVVTDIGVVRPNVLDALCDCDIVMLESNHDKELLRLNRTYTPMLKKRISSEYGHLSNNDCGDACAYLACHGVKNFILAHLSEDNNTPEIAISAVRSCIEQSGVKDCRIVAATQNKPTGLYEIC